MTKNAIRLKAAVIPAVLAAGLAVAAVFLVPVVGQVVAAVIAGMAAVAVAACVWFLLAPVAKAAEAARGVLDGSLDAGAVPDAGGELTDVSKALRHIAHAKVDAEGNFHADLKAMSVALHSLVDPRASVDTVSFTSPQTAHTTAVRQSFEELNKHLNVMRQRYALALRILNALPNAVVTVDNTGGMRFLNSTAEKYLGATAASVARKPFTAVIADGPNEPLDATGDPETPVATRDEVHRWLSAGATGNIQVRLNSGARLELSAMMTDSAGREALLCIVGRDVAVDRVRQSGERATVRANAGRQIIDRYLSESEEPLRQLSAQLRLITGDAKNSGQRDGLLPKLAAAGAGLKRLESYHQLARWFRSLVWGDVPVATPSEFMAVEVANQLAERLTGRMKARGNSLKVIDQGGWLFADSDYIEAALLGLLTHACDATANNQIELRIRRLPAGTDRPAPMTEFHVLDAGPALTADMLSTLNNPFGGWMGGQLDRFADIDGCPLGLIVAARLAPLLNGDLRIEGDSAGQLRVWLTVPTRIGVEPPVTIAAAAPGALDIAPYEEMVIGWRLGMPTGGASV